MKAVVGIVDCKKAVSDVICELLCSVVELTTFIEFDKLHAILGKLAHLAATVVIISMCRTPRLKASPAKIVAAFRALHMQAPVVLFNICLAVGATFSDQPGQVFAFGVLVHSLVVTTIVHPLRHVAATCRIMSLNISASEAGLPSAL